MSSVISNISIHKRLLPFTSTNSNLLRYDKIANVEGVRVTDVIFLEDPASITEHHFQRILVYKFCLYDAHKA